MFAFVLIAISVITVIMMMTTICRQYCDKTQQGTIILRLIFYLCAIGTVCARCIQMVLVTTKAGSLNNKMSFMVDYLTISLVFCIGYMQVIEQYKISG